MTLHVPKFCPECGSSFGGLIPKGGEMTCLQCGHVHYCNVAGVANLIVPHEGGIFVQRRGIEPGIGLWGLPGGYMMAGESWQRAAARETREEIMVEVRWNLSDIAEHSFGSSYLGHTLVVFGRVMPQASIEVHPFTPHREVLERRLISWRDWTYFRNQIAFPLHELAIDKYFRSLR